MRKVYCPVRLSVTIRTELQPRTAAPFRVLYEGGSQYA